MEYVLYIIGWLLIGFLSFCGMAYHVRKQLTLGDIMNAFKFSIAGVIGFIIIIGVAFFVKIEEIDKKIDWDKRIL